VLKDKLSIFFVLLLLLTAGSFQYWGLSYTK